MSQSRTLSAIEVLVSNAIAFVIAIGANQLILPLFGFQVSLTESVTMTIIFTLISVTRSYVVRRAFNRIAIRL